MDTSSKENVIHYDLPNADVILYEGLFTQNESETLQKNLIEKIQWRQDKIKMFGKLINQPRLTAFYGDTDKEYSYSGIVMKPIDWNEDLLFIKNRVVEIAKINFTSVLLNYYRDGKDSMGWHSDDEKELGQNPFIGSVSFGESRVFQMRHKIRKEIKRVDIPLTNGSILLMRGATQHFWQHQIPKSSKQLQTRINLTFRNIQ
jgi:alkylated DNA repair dioxygenase AlkB